jgi:hypothetical protein
MQTYDESAYASKPFRHTVVLAFRVDNKAQIILDNAMLGLVRWLPRELWLLQTIVCLIEHRPGSACAKGLACEQGRRSLAHGGASRGLPSATTDC